VTAAVQEVSEFLRAVPPFEGLTGEEVDSVADACRIEFFAAGATILAEAAAPADAAWVVRRGAVELIAEGRVVDLLGEGEMFGHRALLTEDPLSFSVRAHEDTLCYAIPSAVLLPILTRPSSLRYVVRSVGGRMDMLVRDARATEGADPADRPLADLITAPPLVCPPRTTVREAARMMVDQGQSCALVDLGDRLGIVTDRDLRTRVVAAGAPADTPVSAVMTEPARTVTDDRTGADALFEMLDQGVRHLPVLDPQGRVLGVISDTDLMAVEARTPFRLRLAIDHAGSVDELSRLAGTLPETLLALDDARADPSAISRVLSSVHDALTRKLLELGEASLGPPPVPYTWFALGSFARREAVPSSDADSALAWAGPDDDPEVSRWMRSLGAFVADGLGRAGIHPCREGVLAARPLFARSASAWVEATRSWMEDPDQEKAVILISVIADARVVWAPAAVGDRLRAAFAEAPGRPRLLRRLQSLALAYRPPTGFVRDLVVEYDGARRPRLDIKRGGILPVADLARAAAIASGASGTSTAQRLESAAASGTLDERDAHLLGDAFELFTELRMTHQMQQLRAGDRPDDLLRVDELTALTRSYLKDALRAVASVQRGVSSMLSLNR
jgi:CBS domain-containing protein